MSKPYCISVCLLVFLAVAGCSRQVPLRGTVVYSDDGAPVRHGVVVFSTPTFVAQGAIKEDGTFVIGTMKADDGIPKGDYAVTILGADDITFVPTREGRQKEVRRPTIDPKYSRADTSELTFKVDGKIRQFDIKVDRIKK